MKQKAHSIGLYAGIWPPIKKEEKKMVTITKRFEFCYAHFLPSHKGKCANVHGHNSVLEVEVAGFDKGYDGMIMDFGDLKDLINTHILFHLDHKMLNETIPHIGNPTAENIIAWIRDQLEMRIPHGVELISLRLSETDGSWATWTRGAR